MKIKDSSDIIIAPITSTVGGAVSLIRLSGSDSVKTVNQFFPTKDLSRSKGGQFHYGILKDDQNHIIDEVVVYIFRKPNSFTGEEVVEISCHANPFIVKNIIDMFLAKGCRLAEPGEFSQRAFLNGKIDLIQAEAIADLINAQSAAIIRNSLEQLGGKLSSLMKNIRDDLVSLAGFLELELDFSEEDLEVLERSEIENKIDTVYRKIDQLIQSHFRGRALNRGIKVLITGKPNVGKSSLMNALLDRDRVIVSSQPGTTRDIIHEDILINNTLVRFIDTAGIHITQDFIEAEGVERARKMLREANIIVFMFDLSEELTEDDRGLFRSICSEFREKIIVVGNKSDLQIQNRNIRYFRDHGCGLLMVSAKTDSHIQELKDEIGRKIASLQESLPEEILITNERQNDVLVRTRAALKRAQSGLGGGMGYEFVAVDIREAIDSLSELTGEITSEDILQKIFSDFCIGK